MIELIASNLAPIMFLSLVVMLLLGYPVAFTLGANGLLFFLLAVTLSPYAPDTISLHWNLVSALPERVFGIMSNEVLLAVPFFTFMGIVLQRSGMAEDLLETFGQFFGSVPGGLAYAVIFVGTLLAATTGVVAASVVAMGLISLPVMMRYGYDRRLASGTIMASGTLSQILPPSTILIVLADQLGTSVGDMYTVAFLPSLMLTLSFALLVFVVSIVRPDMVPALPPEELRFREANGSRGVWQVCLLFVASGLLAWAVVRTAGVAKPIDSVVMTVCGLSVIALATTLFKRALTRYALMGSSILGLGLAGMALFSQPGSALSLTATVGSAVFFYICLDALIQRRSDVPLISKLAEQVSFVLVPPVLLIFLVLGTIFIGLATPVEAGAMGALGSIVLAGAKRLIDRNADRLNSSMLTEATYSTAKLSAFILFILIGSRVFALTFFGINGHVWVEHLLVSLPGGEIGFLVFTVAIIFLLGCFLDFFEIAFIAIPLLLPAANALGVDLLLMGVLIACTLQTSFLTPPLGFSLFFLRSVAPKEPYRDPATGATVDGVTTKQIYMGGIPFVFIQIALVILILAVPTLFIVSRESATVMDKAQAIEALDGISVGEEPMGDLGIPDFGVSDPGLN